MHSRTVAVQSPVSDDAYADQRLQSSNEDGSSAGRRSRSRRSQPLPLGGNTSGPIAGTDDILYCLCQSKYDGELMILCCSCDEWYHPKCVGLSRTGSTHTTATFICPTCKKMEELVRARQAKAMQALAEANGLCRTGTVCSSPRSKEAKAMQALAEANGLCRTGTVCSSPRSKEAGARKVAGPKRPRAAGSPSSAMPSPSSTIHPRAVLVAAVEQHLAAGLTSRAELLSVLEKDTAIPWDVLRTSQPHWKRTLIREVVRERFSMYSLGTNTSPKPSTPSSLSSSPKPAKAKGVPLAKKQRLEVEQQSPPSFSDCNTALQLAAQLMEERTRVSTRNARFKGGLRKTESEDEQEEEIEGSVHCLCRKTWDGSFMVRCDSCKVWYHPRCMGLTRVACDLPGRFYCPACRSK